MIGLLVDNGPGFIALDAIEVARKLPVHLIHDSAGYPEGHGKVERFNRTATEQLLRLRHFLREQYNQAPHESLGGITMARFDVLTAHGHIQHMLQLQGMSVLGCR